TSFSFTFDTVLPAAPVVALVSDTGNSGSDHITSNPALTVTNAEVGAVVEYSTDGVTFSTTQPAAAEGANSIRVRQTDVAGNVSNVTTFTFTLDTTAPTVTNVTSTKADGAYTVGTVIAITVTFNEPVFVTGIPQLTLATGTTNEVVNITGGSSTNTL